MKLIVSHGHDLPPFWDGRKVEWQGWTVHESTARFHIPPDVCNACGIDSQISINLGIVHPLPGDMTEDERPKRMPSGRTAYFPVERPARSLLCLSAFRCQHCEHDVVHDMRTDDWWDLDPSDYGDQGSADPRLF